VQSGWHAAQDVTIGEFAALDPPQACGPYAAITHEGRPCWEPAARRPTHELTVTTRPEQIPSAASDPPACGQLDVPTGRGQVDPPRPTNRSAAPTSSHGHPRAFSRTNWTGPRAAVGRVTANLLRPEAPDLQVELRTLPPGGTVGGPSAGTHRAQAPSTSGMTRRWPELDAAFPLARAHPGPPPAGRYAKRTVHPRRRHRAGLPPGARSPDRPGGSRSPKPAPPGRARRRRASRGRHDDIAENLRGDSVGGVVDHGPSPFDGPDTTRRYPGRPPRETNLGRAGVAAPRSAWAQSSGSPPADTCHSRQNSPRRCTMREVKSFVFEPDPPRNKIFKKPWHSLTPTRSPRQSPNRAYPQGRAVSTGSVSGTGAPPASTTPSDATEEGPLRHFPRIDPLWTEPATLSIDGLPRGRMGIGGVAEAQGFGRSASRYRLIDPGR